MIIHSIPSPWLSVPTACPSSSSSISSNLSPLRLDIDGRTDLGSITTVGDGTGEGIGEQIYHRQKQICIVKYGEVILEIHVKYSLEQAVL